MKNQAREKLPRLVFLTIGKIIGKLIEEIKIYGQI